MSMIALLAGLIALDYICSWLFMSRPKQVRIVAYPSRYDLRTSIVFPGFSNPPAYFGQGMERILGGHGPMLVVHHSTRLRFDEIYEATMTALCRLNGPKELLVYGHSMGGQLGELFRERYEQEGSPYGPICELFLDCTPSTAKSLAGPAWLKVTLRIAFKVYWGGPFLSLIVALGNYISRYTIPAPRSADVDAALYRKYARGLMWFNNRAWVAQMRHMLAYRPPEQPAQTHARVIYIGATDPSRGGLVRQEIAIRDWRKAHPSIEITLDEAVGHAWPMEQPEAYARIVRSVLNAVVA